VPGRFFAAVFSKLCDGSPIFCREIPFSQLLLPESTTAPGVDILLDSWLSFAVPDLPSLCPPSSKEPKFSLRRSPFFFPPTRPKVDISPVCYSPPASLAVPDTRLQPSKEMETEDLLVLLL